MWTLPGPLSEKLNFKFAINSKMDFSGGQKQKKCIFTLNFTFLGELGSLVIQDRLLDHHEIFRT